MFDVGFWELALIGVIALIVVGPDRLPGMARTVGFWVGRARRYVDQVKRDVEREIHAEELRNVVHGKTEGLEDLYEAVDETRSAVKEAAADFESTTRTAAAEVSDAAETGGPSAVKAPSGAAAAATEAPAVTAEPAPVPGEADRAGSTGAAPDGDAAAPWTSGIREPATRPETTPETGDEPGRDERRETQG